MEHKEYRLAAIMYTDIAGFSRMLERDEAGTIELLRRHNRIISDSVETHGGRIIKTVGDAHLVDFSNTLNAVRCAIDIQEATTALNADNSENPVLLRIGVHLGDIYFFEDDAVGEGINIASRLQAVATPGRICVSQDVYNLVASKVDRRTVEMGTVDLKNVSRKIDAYEIVVEEAGETDGQGPARRQQANQEGASSTSKESTVQANLRSPEYADFNELKALVLAEIKKAGKRISVQSLRERLPFKSKEVDRVLESLADRGFLTRVEQKDGGTSYAAVRRPMVSPPDRRGEDQDSRKEREIEARWEAALREEPVDTGQPGFREDPLVTEYKEQTLESADKARAGFRGHLGSYIGVNGFLFVVWILTGAGFPWFLIPAMAWGIGLATHWSTTKDKQRESRELQSYENLNREQLRILRKLNKTRSSFRSHLVSNVATSAFLFVLNMITSPGFPWFLFPVGGMAIGLFTHFPSFKSKEKSLLKRLRDAGVRIGGGGRRAVPAVAGSNPSEQAEQLKANIVKQIEGFGKRSQPLGDDFLPLLENYVTQIKELSKKHADLEEIMATIPMASLERDLHDLERKRDQVDNERVRAEYDKSVEQIRDQQRSYVELKNEKEMLALRVRSALNSLKQMQIDLARMKSLSPKEEQESLATLREKSEDLSLYLEDLRKGYEELDR
jgi:class 3 adenylate cyclase